MVSEASSLVLWKMPSKRKWGKLQGSQKLEVLMREVVLLPVAIQAPPRALQAAARLQASEAKAQALSSVWRGIRPTRLGTCIPPNAIDTLGPPTSGP